MAVTTKRKSGAASATIKSPQLRSLPQTIREPRRGNDLSYEEARINEVENRSELYHLRVRRIRAGLLDRLKVEEEYTAIIGEIRRIIDGSRLSKAEKRDVLGNILTPGGFIEAVTQRQRADTGQKDESPANNAGIDQEF